MKEIILQTTWQEWLGVVFSIFQVVLARYNNPKNYFFGIAGILLTLVVMFNSKLYAEFTLNIYYLVMSIYGLLYWKYHVDKIEKLNIDIPFKIILLKTLINLKKIIKG